MTDTMGEKLSGVVNTHSFTDTRKHGGQGKYRAFSLQKKLATVLEKT
jgi:hypothetical protein